MESSRVRITFLGDALCHPPLLEGQKEPGGGYDFRPVFAPLRDLLSQSDLVVANLETPLSEDDGDLTHERWCFNSPRAYAESLQWAGVGFVTTANNHCLDRGTAGIAATIRVLNGLGLPHTGTFADRETAARPAIAEVGGFRLGILSYTYGTNAFSNHQYLRPEESFMVNLFQEQELSESGARVWIADRTSPEGRAYEEMERRRWPENLTLPVYERIEPFEARRAHLAADVANVRAAGPDFVALAMHTGGQYNPEATARTKELAAFAHSCGVDFVVGNHEHVVHGGDFSRLREGRLSTYCLGDLASATGLWSGIPHRDPPHLVAFTIAWHIDLERSGSADGPSALIRNPESRPNPEAAVTALRLGGAFAEAGERLAMPSPLPAQSPREATLLASGFRRLLGFHHAPRISGGDTEGADECSDRRWCWSADGSSASAGADLRAARVRGSSFTVLVRRKGTSFGRVVVHPAAELWRSLPAGTEKDALAADIRAAASVFAGRSFENESIKDEYPV